jgi:hypothetical protein
MEKISNGDEDGGEGGGWVIKGILLMVFGLGSSGVFQDCPWSQGKPANPKQNTCNTKY